MVTTLRVIVDEILDPAQRGIARYAEELTRALIETAPPGCEVEGFVSASPETEYEELRRRLPGMARLVKSSLARRELTAAWQHGFTATPGGILHSPSLLAPLRRHNRSAPPYDQTVVTIHDALAWTHPDTLPGRRASSLRGLGRRAAKYADAVVVPSYAVADELAEHLELGDRIRVIPGAVALSLRLPERPDEVVARLGLPDRYVLTLATLNPRKRLQELLDAVAELGVPLVIAGNPSWSGRSMEDILAQRQDQAARVLVLGPLPDEELAAVYDRAAVFVHPSDREGFGLPVLEAFSFATPTVISDDPALMEVAADAALVVERSGGGYAERLRDAIRSVLDDAALAERLGVAGQDRSHAFTWRDAAEKVWQLHADL